MVEELPQIRSRLRFAGARPQRKRQLLSSWETQMRNTGETIRVDSRNRAFCDADRQRFLIM